MAALDPSPSQAPALPKPTEIPSLSQSIFHLEKKGVDESSPGLNTVGSAVPAR